MTIPGRRAWLKLWAAKTIDGTTFQELLPDERACWFGFLCLAALSPISGTICATKDVPYTEFQLSKMLNITPKLLRRATKRMQEVGKISVNGAGIHITNWEHYQGDFVRVQKHRARVTNETPQRSVTNETRRGRGRGRGEGREEKISSSSATGARVGEIARVYEANIGAITSMVADELVDIADTYPSGWFEAAVKEAVNSNHRSLNYVKAILERWKVEGFKTPLRRQPAGGAGARAKRALPTAQQLQEGWKPDEES